MARCMIDYDAGKGVAWVSEFESLHNRYLVRGFLDLHIDWQSVR